MHANQELNRWTSSPTKALPGKRYRLNWKITTKVFCTTWVKLISLNWWLINLTLKTQVQKGSESISDFVAEPENKATLLTIAEYLRAIENLNYRSGMSSVKVLAENYLIAPTSLMFHNFNPFFATLKEKNHQLIVDGVIKYFPDWQFRQ